MVLNAVGELRVLVDELDVVRGDVTLIEGDTSMGDHAPKW